jgi:hypothetical protein
MFCCHVCRCYVYLNFCKFRIVTVYRMKWRIRTKLITLKFMCVSRSWDQMHLKILLGSVRKWLHSVVLASHVGPDFSSKIKCSDLKHCHLRLLYAAESTASMCAMSKNLHTFYSRGHSVCRVTVTSLLVYKIASVQISMNSVGHIWINSAPVYHLATHSILATI